MRPRAPPVGVILDSVSCASAGNCSVVGSYWDSSATGDGLLLSETDGSWSAGVEAVLPSDASTTNGFVEFASVSCASVGNCTAVGLYNASSTEDGLVLTQTAGSWSDGIEAAVPANRGPAFGAAFAGSVSCPSAGDCSAVGIYYDTSGVRQGLLLGGDPTAVNLEVSRRGTGSGTVSSQPAGIHCGSACSGSWGAGTALTLTPTAAPGSRFSGWTGGGCSRVPLCEVSTAVGDQTVIAKFTLLPKCVVPRVKGKTLKAAEHTIRTRNCSIGKIDYARSQTVKRGHVISQRPKPGRRLQRGTKVNLVISKG